MIPAAALGMGAAAGGVAGGSSAAGLGGLASILGGLGGLGGKKKQQAGPPPVNFIQPSPMQSQPITTNNDYNWIQGLMQDPLRTF